MFNSDMEKTEREYHASPKNNAIIQCNYHADQLCYTNHRPTYAPLTNGRFIFNWLQAAINTTSTSLEISGDTQNSVEQTTILLLSTST